MSGKFLLIIYATDKKLNTTFTCYYNSNYIDRILELRAVATNTRYNSVRILTLKAIGDWGALFYTLH